MPNITANIVDALEVSGKELVTVRYNNWDANVTKANMNAIAPYSQVPSLPPLREPLMVQNAMLVAGNAPIGNGQAAVMPPGVTFSFKIGYLCSLGFEYTVTLLPVNKQIRKDATWPTTPPVAPWQYKYWTVDRWQNGDLIRVDDAQFANTGDLTPEKEHYVKNSFQIRIDVAPMTSITMGDGTTYKEKWPAPGAKAAGDTEGNVNTLNANTHNGTIGRGKPTGPIHYTEVQGWDIDHSRSTVMVFDVLVFNEKYYKHQNAELFQKVNMTD